MNYKDALTLLTDYNLDKFIEYDFKPNVIDRIIEYTTDEDGNVVVDFDATERERKKAWAQLNNAVVQIRSFYGKIDVIGEDDNPENPSDFYVYKGYLKKLDYTVFAYDVENNLIGIMTDKYNDVFTWQDLERGMTDVINSADPKSRLANKKQYRFADCNFYLCENCSKCEECDELVACGEDEDSAIGYYFSKYCAEHACRFVWKWEVDENNPSGVADEGLKCRERRIDGSNFCNKHECANTQCLLGIVGVSIEDASSDAPARATGESDESLYSKYCLNHKCLAILCKETSLNSNASVDTSNPACVTSDCYCSIHNHGCNIFVPGNPGNICGKAVIKKAYESSGKLICEEHWGYFSGTSSLDNPNNIPARYGKCSGCGSYHVMYLNGSYCNGCLKSNYYEEGMSDLELIIAIKQDMAIDGIADDEFWAEKSKGLLVNVYDEFGNLLYENMNITVFRSQDLGLRPIKNDAGEVCYIAYGWNCVNYSVNVLGRVLDEANGVLYKSQKGQVKMGETYYIVDATGKVYEITNSDSSVGSCGAWDDWTTDKKLATPVIEETYNYGDKRSATEIVNMLNSCVAYNTGNQNGSAQHTTSNTGKDITYTVDGVEKTGKIFISFGKGEGTKKTDKKGSGTYTPDIVSYYADGGKIYRVNFGVDSNGELYPSNVSEYDERIVGIYDFGDNQEVI